MIVCLLFFLNFIESIKVDRYCITLDSDVQRVVVPIIDFKIGDETTAFVTNQPVRYILFS